MTSEPSTRASGRFVLVALPWVIGAAALGGYLLTLNRWLTFFNVGLVAKVFGLHWQPEISNPMNPVVGYPPLYYLATYPFRWLQEAQVPLALNLFSAACAAITVGLLARSVALLPHDRTHEQRERETSAFSVLSIPAAWLPPLLAVLVCGLQMTFWEHATNGSTEMLDLLLFAFVIRELLEYRLEGHDPRLYRAAFVYGLGLANNFAMVGFFPAFIVALLWICGLSFFNARFLGRMALCGLAGLLLHVLLPLVSSFSTWMDVGFWGGLKFSLASPRSIIVFLMKNGRPVLALMSLTSLLPILVISIRWASHFGDSSRVGTAFTTVMVHVFHGALMLACLWVAFDPPFSPRQSGFGFPFLTFYYLGALSIGYFTGYFLLIFRDRASRLKRTPGWLQIVNRVVTGLVLVLSVLVPVALGYRNLPQIRATNGPMLQEYARLMTQTIPDDAIAFSDDMRRLFIARFWLAKEGRGTNVFLLDSQSLRWPGYHRFLEQRFPQRWQKTVEKDRMTLFEPVELAEIVSNLATNSALYYLHPSFGYYFETFYPEPNGLGSRLKRYPKDSLLPPAPSDEVLARNAQFWKNADPKLKLLFPLISPEPEFKFVEDIFLKIGLHPIQNAQAMELGIYYARSLTEWGVQLQRLNQLNEAATCFELALKLNADNLVAENNLACNRQLRAGKVPVVKVKHSLEEQFFGKLRNWEQVLAINGPYDEPAAALMQGMVFLIGGNYRQSAIPLDRVRAMWTNELNCRLLLAQLNLTAQLPDKVLELTTEIRDRTNVFMLTESNRTDLLSLEASAYFAKQEPDKATQLIESALARNTNDLNLLNTAINLYSQNRLYSNALVVLERGLALYPDDPAALVNKGYLYVQMHAYDEAIVALSRAVNMDTNNHPALLNRAIAYLRADKLDEARADYETLQRLYPTAFQVSFGLGEIAWRHKDTNTAIRNYQSYLSNAVPNSAEAKLVADRLRDLQGPNKP